MYACHCGVPSCAPDVPPIINIQSSLLRSDNKLVPDMTVIPLPMAVSLQPMMITDILPQEQTFVLIGYLFFRSPPTMTTTVASCSHTLTPHYVFVATVGQIGGLRSTPRAVTVAKSAMY